MNEKKYPPTQEVWSFYLNDLEKSFYLRFYQLISSNNFKKATYIYGVLFEKKNQKEVKKTPFKEVYDLKQSVNFLPQLIEVGDCRLSNLETKGFLRNQNQSLIWNFNLQPKNHQASLQISGDTEINKKKLSWDRCEGSSKYFKIQKKTYSWIQVQCHSFENEKGHPTSFSFKAKSVRYKYGLWVSPHLSTFEIEYQNKKYILYPLKSYFSSRSSYSLNSWEFRSDLGPLSFRGKIYAEHPSFIGIPFENIQGQLFYTYISLFAKINISVYREGKLEDSFYNKQGAFLEIASQTKNPYISAHL